MLGDKMYLYDRNNGRFFAGWNGKCANGAILPPIWSTNAREAKIVSSLRYAYDLKERLGEGVRIVSETEARKIDKLREYREAASASG